MEEKGEIDWGKEKVSGRIYTTGGAISWVEGTGDVSGVNGVVWAQVVVEVFENAVDMLVVAVVVPPSLNDHVVVTRNFKVSASATSPSDCIDEQLKANCFRPCNVVDTVDSFPSRDEPPGTPSVSKDDCDSNLGAHIRVGTKADQLNRARYGTAKVLFRELSGPPFEVRSSGGGGTTGHERLVTE